MGGQRFGVVAVLAVGAGGLLIGLIVRRSF